MDSTDLVAALGGTTLQNAGVRARGGQAAEGFDALLSAFHRDTEAGRPGGPADAARAETSTVVDRRQPRARDGSGAAAPDSTRAASTHPSTHARPARASQKPARSGGDDEDRTERTGARHDRGDHAAQQAAPVAEARSVEPPSKGHHASVAADVPAAGDAIAEPSTDESASSVTADAAGLDDVPAGATAADETGLDAATSKPADDASLPIAPAGLVVPLPGGVAAEAAGAGVTASGEAAVPAGGATSIVEGGDASTVPGTVGSPVPDANSQAAAALADLAPSDAVGPVESVPAEAPAVEVSAPGASALSAEEPAADGQPPAGDGGGTGRGEIDGSEKLPGALARLPWRQPVTGSVHAAPGSARRLMAAVLAGGGDASEAVSRRAAPVAATTTAADTARSFAPVVTPATLFGEARAVGEGQPTAAPSPDMLSFAMVGIAEGRAQSQSGGQHGWGAAHANAAAWAAGIRAATGGDASAQTAMPVFLDSAMAAATGGTTAAAGVSTTGLPASDAPVGQQVVRAISLAWRDGVGEAHVRLTPEHLGEVSVALRVEKGVVTAVLQAETPAARDWIRAHESELRQALESQGLQLDSLVVTDEGQSRGRQDPQDQPRRPAPRPDTDPNAPRFEVQA